MNFLNMSFHNGTTRFVVTIPWLGIALKFAHIHPIRALKTLVWMGENRNKKLTFKRMLGWSDKVDLSLRYQFRGIYCNLREYQFCKSSRNPLLWPTLFSFFGLINIQPFAQRQPEERPDSKLWIFVRRVTNEFAYKDSHAFSEEKNYVIDRNGYLRILDYGSKASHKIIREYGHQLYSQSRHLF